MLPTAFAAVEEVIGRAALDKCIKRSLEPQAEPGSMHELLAERHLPDT